MSSHLRPLLRPPIMDGLAHLPKPSWNDEACNFLSQYSYTCRFSKSSFLNPHFLGSRKYFAFKINRLVTIWLKGCQVTWVHFCGHQCNNGRVSWYQTSWNNSFYHCTHKYVSNGILLPNLFWPTVRENCSSDRGKLAENLQKFWDHQNNLFKQWKVWTIFGNRMLF